MNFPDILMTSPQYLYKKSIGTRGENLFFDFRGKGLREMETVVTWRSCDVFM